MIAYLHIPIVPFLPLPSNFLIELEEEDRHEEDDFDEFKTSPAEWLRKQFKKLKNQPEWHVEPCSAHAMYRLADCYNLEDLRDLSLGFILRSLTIKNVSLPLPSFLSSSSSSSSSVD
jgi:hypothetical protein